MGYWIHPDFFVFCHVLWSSGNCWCMLIFNFCNLNPSVPHYCRSISKNQFLPYILARSLSFKKVMPSSSCGLSWSKPHRELWIGLVSSLATFQSSLWDFDQQSTGITPFFYENIPNFPASMFLNFGPNQPQMFLIFSQLQPSCSFNFFILRLSFFLNGPKIGFSKLKNGAWPILPSDLFSFPHLWCKKLEILEFQPDVLNFCQISA